MMPHNQLYHFVKTTCLGKLGSQDIDQNAVGCSYTSIEATVLSCHFSWAWSGMPEVL